MIRLNLQAKNKKCPPEPWGNLPLLLLSQRPAPSEKAWSRGEMPEEKGTVAWLLGKINSQVIAWMVTQRGFEDRLFKAPGRGNRA